MTKNLTSSKSATLRDKWRLRRYLSPEGKVMEKAGAVRDGGSFQDRMGRVACWNSVMTEDRYMVRKWNEFIAA